MSTTRSSITSGAASLTAACGFILSVVILGPGGFAEWPIVVVATAGGAVAGWLAGAWVFARDERRDGIGCWDEVDE